MDDHSIKLAQKRIWKRLENKLPDRGVSLYQPVLRELREAQVPVQVTRLKQVQLKERLLEILPEATELPLWPSFFTRRFWSVSTLGILLSVVLFSGLRLAPSVLAASETTLKRVEGEVRVNGAVLEESVPIQEGDILTTGEGSLAHLTLLDDSRVTLGPSTTLKVVQLEVDSDNPALTQVVLQEDSGEVWTQVLNLVSEGSSFVLKAGAATMDVTQNASFDVKKTEDQVLVRVAGHWVDLEIQTPEVEYQTVLAQDEALTFDARIQLRSVTDEERSDVWWTFNSAYGQAYARLLDESYKQEHIERATILPGSPFYPLKTFREKVQLSFTWGAAAKQKLLVEQAQTRLSEAKVLLAAGQLAEAKETLNVYEATVQEAVDTDGAAPVEALLAQAQKETVVEALAQTPGSGSGALIQDSLDSTVQVLAQAVSETPVLALPSADHLALAPDFVEQKRYEEAAAALKTYADRSAEIGRQLAALSGQEQAVFAQSLLESQMSELQDLRVLAGLDLDSENLSEDEKQEVRGIQAQAAQMRDQELKQIANLTALASTAEPVAVASEPNGAAAGVAVGQSSSAQGVAAASTTGAASVDATQATLGLGTNGEQGAQSTTDGGASIKDPRFEE